MKKSILLLCLAFAGLALFSGRILQSLKARVGQNPIEVEAAASALGATPGATGSTAVAVSLTNSPAATALAAAPQRLWDPAFFDRLHDTSPGQAIRFELVGSDAQGVVKYLERTNGRVIYVSGDLSSPEPGRFFFQVQNAPGLAGDYVGIVEFPGSKIGYRLEPIGPNRSSVLVRLPLDKIVCMAMPAPDPSLLAPEEIPPLEPADFPDYPIPDYQDGIIPLQSLPGSTAVLYIDYRGGYTPTWGGITYERPNVSNAQIRDVWKRVAEDYMPFNINVTTDIKVYENAPQTTRQRCVCTPTTTAAPGAGGVAYIGDWNSSGDRPCWSFYSTGKSAAEVISHEVGHTLQLGHDGRITPDEGYFGGHGSGDVGWAPIMGVGYYRNVAQWSRGEYASANNTEDDLAKIVGNNNNVDYRADDTGANLATSRYLEVYPNNTAQAEGVISTTGETDAFQFTTTATGTVSLRANAVGDWANLAMSVTLCNSSDVVIASNNPQTTLWAALSTTLPAGTYTFRVTGAGRNSPLTNGFSSYASLGYYSISGTVPNARQPDRFSIPENSPAGTLVGVIPANNPNGGPLSYVITGGNLNNAFSVDSLGQLRVLNAGVLNYETLASNTQLPVQYQLLVNINNLTNSAFNEVQRRVVVAITDANEAPATANLSLSVLEHTQAGTVIGKVTGTDPDFYNLINFAIVSGDPNGRFSVGSQSGEISVAGDLARAIQSTYLLRVAVFDNIGPVPMSSTSSVTVTVMPNTTPFQPGSANYAIYPNISGNVLSGLTGSPSFPTDPASEKPMPSLEGETDRGDNYGSVMRAYLIPPGSGAYTFFIASDDNSELRMSTTTNPASAAVIASVSGSGSWTSPREWTKFSSQRSAARTLVAGQAYYIEARQKEGTGGDNLAVGWTGPGIVGTNVIAGTYLAPYPMNYRPRASGFIAELRREAFPGFRIGRIAVSDVNPTDSHRFTIIGGDLENIFAVDSEGWVIVTNTAVLQATATPSFALTVNVADSGVPVYSTNVSATISIAETGTLPVALRREMFKNIGGGTAVSDLTSNAKYPGKVDELVTLNDFSTGIDVADNFGSRIRAILVPPTSGSYRFYIASDDASQLKLSTTTNPASAAVIASLATYSSPGVYNKEAAQISAYRTLIAGQRYYIEALQKEGGGGDHLSVAWTLPGTVDTNVIASAYLEPFDLGIAPQIANQSLTVFESALNGAVIGRLTASDSPLDTLTYQIMSGNTNDTFALNPATGDVILNNNALIVDGSVANFALLVAVQDSGCGGLYPLRTAQATVSINVISTNSPLVWLGASATNRWSDPGNWGGIVPYEGSRLIFGASFQQANVNDVLTQAAWVRMTNSGFNLSGNPLTLQSGLTNIGNNSWNLDTTLAGPQVWNNASGTLTVGGNINNAGFNLSLVGATDIRVSGALSGSGTVTKTGAGKLLIAGSHDLTGVFNVATAGTSLTALEVNGTSDLDLSGADLVMSGRMDLWNRSATIGGLSGNGTIFANDSARRLTVGANDHSGNFSGVLANNSWATTATLGLLKIGTGTQVLSGANTYSGGTIIRSGQITVTSAYALGTGLVTLGDPGTSTNSVTLAASLAVTVTNSLAVSAQAGSPIAIGTANFAPGSVNMQYTGPLTLNRDVLLQAGSTDRTTFAGQITGPGGLQVVSPFGPNRRIVLDRASGLSNTFAGEVLIGTNAVLQAGNSTSIGNRTVPDTALVSFSPGAQLRFAPSAGGDSETIGALDSLVSGAGQIDLTTAVTFTLGFGARDGLFSGSINDTLGTLALRKSGSATQVLAGPSSFAGLVTVSGGTLVVAADSALGASSSGTVVSPGATLALSNNLVIASEVLSLNGTGVGDSGALRNDHGQNTCSGIVSLAGPAKVRAGTGQLTLADVSLGVSTLTLETFNDAAIVISGSGSGLGGIQKVGPGPLTLSGTNLYTGPTFVAEGPLVLAPSAAISNTSPITVQSVLDAFALTNWVLQASQTLQGNGVVTGAVTVLGTLSPGVSLGNLTIQGDVSLAGTTWMEISRSASGPTNDVLTSTGAIVPGGLLVVTNIGPDLPVPGDTFRLFAAGALSSGAFSTIQLPQVTGVAWDTSRIYAEGVLVAILGEPTQPPPLSLGSTNGVLTITWPVDYTSYVLQAQTNDSGAGLSGSWYPVPGVTSNTFTIPIDSAQGSVFYRLQKQ